MAVFQFFQEMLHDLDPACWFPLKALLLTVAYQDSTIWVPFLIFPSELCQLNQWRQNKRENRSGALPTWKATLQSAESWSKDIRFIRETSNLRGRWTFTVTFQILTLVGRVFKGEKGSTFFSCLRSCFLPWGQSAVLICEVKHLNLISSKVSC